MELQLRCPYCRAVVKVEKDEDGVLYWVCPCGASEELLEWSDIRLKMLDAPRLPGLDNAS